VGTIDTDQLSYEESTEHCWPAYSVNVGLRDEKQDYQGVRGGVLDPSKLRPISPNPKWIMAAERVQTNKDYGRIVARIPPGLDRTSRISSH